MACHFNDNVYTKVFTPREYQVELLDSLKERNTIVCLGNISTKLFLTVKLVQELAAHIRRPFSNDGKRSVFIFDSKNIPLVSSYICHLTDLSVCEILDLNFAKELNEEKWNKLIEDNHIFVFTSEVCLCLVTKGYIVLDFINLLVIDDCRLALKENTLSQFIKGLSKGNKTYPGNTRVLGFTSITLNQQCDPARLEAEFEFLEKILCCSVDTSSDIVTVLRYCTKPQEKILVCADAILNNLSERLEKVILEVKQFLDDHRYDPYEIYEDEFKDELQGVPDPKVEPLNMIEEFLFILNTLGPWCADRAAFALLIKIENQKVKTPYERHYLLLSMLSTAFVRIRAICDDEFQKYGDNNTDCVLSNCTPRVLRLIEVLKTFKPPVSATEKSEKNSEESSPKSEPPVNDMVNNMGLKQRPMQQYSSIKNWKARNAKGYRKDGPYKNKYNNLNDQEILCAIIFVEKRFTAKILFYLISELCRSTDDLSYLSVQYTVEKISDPLSGGKEAENEHRKQEEVLKKFRMHECNLLVATSILEEGIDIPKCNLVIRFDQPLTYNSYVQSKGRAKMPKAHYILMSEESQLSSLVEQMARYREIEKMLLNNCNNKEPMDMDEQDADKYTSCIEAYTTVGGATVNMTTAIALVNKYCAKLPSDTFTRLTALWFLFKEPQTCHELTQPNNVLYTCSIRLPINSPLKQAVKGIAMPSKVLAKRVAALQVCRMLHEMGELDNNLMPVGKETFKAFEEDWNCFPMEESDEVLTKNNLEPRPGTTKRRQYYYKRIADALTNCRPLPMKPAYLYLINMILSCPLPEEQNTRGRKIYPPEESPQGFGILTLKQVPSICPFPIFTRSGEVQVSFELSPSTIELTEEQLGKINSFLNYVFTNVLRLSKYLMLFDPNASENSYFIVPTIRVVENDVSTTQVDWKFLDVIYENRELTPQVIAEEHRKDFQFNSDKYSDAVVMPWYRNQDQPQYFYVAEVCLHLNPKSSFPGTDYKTFEEYYFKKYNIQIQNLQQPLLDVDHTSARLNFLTPRYVNRKGVALPTSSEETKRAKRENLEQKQILVPELCTVHPFPASLWRKAVCLPCILYRLNALLLADEIRKKVAQELALGQINLPSDYKWEPLNFGWSLSDVLKKSRISKEEKENQQALQCSNIVKILSIDESPDQGINLDTSSDGSKTVDEDNSDTKEDNSSNWMEIGTWSNEMAHFSNPDDEIDEFSDNNMIVKWDPNVANANRDVIRYASPTSWINSTCNDFYDYDSDDSCESYSSDADNSESSNKSGGIRIEFTGDNVAEAIDVESKKRTELLMLMAPDEYDHKRDSEQESIIDDVLDKGIQEHILLYNAAVERNISDIMSSGIIVSVGESFELTKCQDIASSLNEQYKVMIESSQSLNNSVVPVNSIVANHLNAKEERQHSPINNVTEECKTDSFSFDFQPDLGNHSGPSPSVILQALTMSNANDGINLERLETIGDSFLKYAITNYLYSTYENIHEGKLSHLRSKQVSNLNLYRLGRAKILGESMIATKFDPHDNWLPPCYYVPRELEQALIDARVPVGCWDQADVEAARGMSKDEIYQMVKEKSDKLGIGKADSKNVTAIESKEENNLHGKSEEVIVAETVNMTFSLLSTDNSTCLIPYNLITQHSIPDKSIADCVEALIGAYLIECGPRGALLFMAWLGIRVLPKTIVNVDNPDDRPVGSLKGALSEDGTFSQVRYGHLTCPRSPLLHYCSDASAVLDELLDGYSAFEDSIGYHFKDRSYLLQAMTHASYSPNTVTDCYQRLEFLGDAVLDFLITRHLYNDPRLHSPGALTDLRSALVNNTIFASLAVRHGFHKYFRHLSPGLHEVVNRFVQIQEENGHSICEEYYLIAEDESEEIEDVEVPKALGDVFESVAGAIFCDSGMSLDAVWLVYYRMMRNEIEQFSTSVPKSPIRELLELEPETAKFGKPEKLADGRRVRVTVEVFGKGTFKGIGRNYRIAKCTAAKCALKQLKKRGMITRKS